VFVVHTNHYQQARLTSEYSLQLRRTLYYDANKLGLEVPTRTTLCRFDWHRMFGPSPKQPPPLQRCALPHRHRRGHHRHRRKYPTANPSNWMMLMWSMIGLLLPHQMFNKSVHNSVQCLGVLASVLLEVFYCTCVSGISFINSVNNCSGFHTVSSKVRPNRTTTNECDGITTTN
jgi:hypothetical protein